MFEGIACMPSTISRLFIYSLHQQPRIGFLQKLQARKYETLLVKHYTVMFSQHSFAFGSLSYCRDFPFDVVVEVPNKQTSNTSEE